MYTTSVPFIVKTVSKHSIDKAIAEAKRSKANRVMLAVSNGPGNAVMGDSKEAKEKMLLQTKKVMEAFKKEGFEVGIWVWTFMTKSTNFTHIESPLGNTVPDECCPADTKFGEFVADFLKSFAELEPDFILLDDDYRLGFFFHVQIGCTCKHHMKMISDDLGEKLKSSDIKDHLLSGGRNKYRSAFIRANRKSLLDFAAKMRKSIDSVNPNIRLGLCSCISSWDIDGANSVEVAKVLAGNTKPLLRLIGAPYWAAQNAWGNTLSDVIELIRLERSWCPEGDEIEIISEGDTYPRPRFYVPASYLEMYDIALRTDGTISGILKYMNDYVSSTDYEKGYVDTHVKNFELYKKIEKCFSNKNACGIRIYEAMSKYEDMDIPSCWEGTEFVSNIFFPISTRLISAASVPTKFYGNGAGIAFGENIKYVKKNAFSDGLIIDIDAAIILHNNGVDVGISDIGDTITPYSEDFSNGECTRLGSVRSRNIIASENAEIASTLNFKNGTCPGSYYYENEDGHKFLVLNFEAYGYTFHNENDSFYKNYLRQHQIVSFYEKFTGKKLPCHIKNNPFIYIIAKKSDDETVMSVCVFNFSADAITNGVIELDDDYTSIEFLAGSGKLCGNKLTTEKIPAFDYIIFEVNK